MRTAINSNTETGLSSKDDLGTMGTGVCTVTGTASTTREP